MVEASTTEDMSVTAQARKRRMERRSKKLHDDSSNSNKKIRLEDDVDGNVVAVVSSSASSSDSESESSHHAEPSSTLSKDALAKIPGVKKQARYVPATTAKLSKAELSQWRKEARRVRNRESAAASRQKTQKRITELEDEVGTLTKKYEAALRRIVELEAAAVAAQDNGLWKPLKKKNSKPQEEPTVTMVSSPVLRSTPANTVSPPMSPRDSFSLYDHQGEEGEPVRYQEMEVKTSALHTALPSTTTTKISRHNACVKIPIIGWL